MVFLVKAVINNFNPSLRIDMMSMTDSTHTFGLYSKDEGLIKKLELPIVENGNYPFNPTPKKFGNFIINCSKDTSKFNYSYYYDYMNN
jgi:hypothetical protein